MVSKDLARSGGLAACSACDVVLFVRRETAAALSPGQELLQNFSQKIGPFAAALDGLPDSRWFVEERAIGLHLCCMAYRQSIPNPSSLRSHPKGFPVE